MLRFFSWCPFIFLQQANPFFGLFCLSQFSLVKIVYPNSNIWHIMTYYAHIVATSRLLPSSTGQEVQWDRMIIKKSKSSCGLQSRIKSGVGSECNAYHFLRLTERNPFFGDKKCRILMFCDNLWQNGILVLHNCNLNATFKKWMLHREPEKETGRERARGRESWRERERDPAKEPERVLERAT